jgi:hypothetical protein
MTIAFSSTQNSQLKLADLNLPRNKTEKGNKNAEMRLSSCARSLSVNKTLLSPIFFVFSFFQNSTA